MIYKGISMGRMLAKVIRDTGLNDSAYAPLLPEWAAECLGMLRFDKKLTATYKDIHIDYHKGLLPCGLISIRAVEYNKTRVRQGLGDISLVEDNERNIPFCTEVGEAMKLPESTKHSYDLDLRGITTSFRSGIVRVHMYVEPCDELGFPMIPDNENYKEALYWYIRAKMIGRGWSDPVFKYNEALSKHEFYAGRAMPEVTWKSIDEMPDMVDLMTRLIPDMDYFDRFCMPDRSSKTERETPTVGIPISSVIVERLATPVGKPYPFKFPSGTHFVFPATQHKLDQVRGVTFLNPAGEYILVPFTLDEAAQTVTVDSSVDLIGHTIIIY